MWRIDNYRMSKISKGAFIVAIATLSVLPLLSPLAAEAKVKKVSRPCYKGFCPALVSITKGADEKNFDNPTTRCLTKDIQVKYEAAKSQMDKDVAKYGQGKEHEIKSYKERVEDGWSAMHEPYCGFGSNGLGAVRHSLDKTFTRARADYLQAVGSKTLAKR